METIRMIKQIIGTIILIDGIASFILAYKLPNPNTHRTEGLLQTGRLLRATLGALICLI